jgi:uncharacterized protein (TIGR00297 family)
MFLSRQDLFTGAVSIVLITTVLLLIELGVKFGLLNKLWGRKILHCLSICVCVWAIGKFENRLALAVIFFIFFLLLLWVIKKGWLQVDVNKTYGIALFPLVFSFLLFVPTFSIKSIVFGGLILAFADAAAGIAGEAYGKQKIHFLFEKKTWEGFVVFLSVAFFTASLHYGFSIQNLLWCFVLAAVPALTELFSYKGSDNFTVPIVSSVWFLLLQNLPLQNIATLAACSILFAILSVFAVLKKWLTQSGGAAACLTAMFLLTTGGFKAFVAPGIFLLSGSLLSKLNNHADEKNGRNAKQVFANGIVGVIFLIFYKFSHNNVYLIATLVSFCISMADSVSSEVGMYFKQTTYNIITFKKMQVGLSGGISLAGTVAGLLGAASIALVVTFVYNVPITTGVIIALAGFGGMLVDSILGSLFQAKYKKANGIILDAAADNATLLKGYAWCNNDAVNIISNALTTLFFLILLKFFG